MQKQKQQEAIETEGSDDYGTELGLDQALEPEAHEFDNDDDEHDDCGPAVNRDMIDDALEELIFMLVQSGYADEDAENAVFDAMELLSANDQLLDTPDISAEEAEKASWIFNYIPKIKLQLKEMGLEFEEAE